MSTTKIQRHIQEGSQRPTTHIFNMHHNIRLQQLQLFPEEREVIGRSICLPSPHWVLEQDV
jgi:hypothetical protein